MREQAYLEEGGARSMATPYSQDHKKGNKEQMEFQQEQEGASFPSKKWESNGNQENENQKPTFPSFFSHIRPTSFICFTFFLH